MYLERHSIFITYTRWFLWQLLGRNMNMKYTIPASLLYVLTLSGCATITGDGMQSLEVTTSNLQGTAISQANCSLKNEKGEWKVTTPNTVNVHKASGNLYVECKKAGLPTGKLQAISRAGKGMYGNILIGGGVGAVIDHKSGAAYKYPSKLPVVMGKDVTVDRRHSK